MKQEFMLLETPIPHLESPLLAERGVRHMFTTRRGGRSEGCFGSLNFAVGQGSVRDSAENVDYHHSLAAAAFGLTVNDTVRAWQLHTATVELATRKNCNVPYGRGVDGLVTGEKGILLTVRTADCVPVLLYDTKKKVCAAVHAGWRGAAGGICRNAVELMLKTYSDDVSDIVAAVGPSAGICCYEVGEDVRSAFDDEIYARCFEERNGKLFFDTAAAVEAQLIASGMSDENISRCGLCTVCNEGFFSHRRQGINRGSQAAFITV